MRLEELTLERALYGAKAHQLYGTVTFKDVDGNEIKIALTPKSIIELVKAIKKEVITTLTATSKDIPKAIEDASTDHNLLTVDSHTEA